MHLCRPCRWHAVSSLFLDSWPLIYFWSSFWFLYSFIGSICHCCQRCSANLQSLWEFPRISSKTLEGPSEGCLHVFRRWRLRMCWFVLFLYYYRSISFIHKENFGFPHLFHMCVLLWECNILLYIICFPVRFVYHFVFTLSFLTNVYSFIWICLIQTDQGNAVKTKILIQFKRLCGDCIWQSQLWLM